MPAKTSLPIAASLLLALPGIAQPTVGGQQQDPSDKPRVEQRIVTYSATLSWALFEACDEDGDDRLFIIEAGRTLGSLSPQDRRAFGALDSDSDGFLQWQEFDIHYQSTIGAGNEFVLRLVRSIHMPFDPTTADEAESLEAQLIRLEDKDGDGLLSDAEFRNFLLSARLPDGPELSVIDTDGSGAVSPEEFEVVVGLLPDAGAAMLATYYSNPNTLLPDYRRADVNRNGAIDTAELEIALIAIDPLLRRWTRRILSDADLSSNGDLSRGELERARK